MKSAAAVLSFLFLAAAAPADPLPEPFRNSESTFYRESGGQLRRDRMAEDGWGSIFRTALLGSEMALVDRHLPRLVSPAGENRPR